MGISKKLDEKLTASKEAFKEAQEAYKKAYELSRGITKEDIKNVFSSFITETQGVESVSWVQYTPYFMDGDPCLFSVSLQGISLRKESPLGKIFIEFVKESGEDLSDDSECGIDEQSETINIDFDYYYLELPQPLQSILDDLDNMILSSETILLQVFGDHITVKISADDIDISEYYHD